MNSFIKKEIVTIPNLLSLFRLVLACAIPVICYHPSMERKIETLLVVIGLSCVTDVLDGKIARRFHMVSEVGKILDPIADKLTQGLLLICLLPKTWAAKAVLTLFFVKETVLSLFGWAIVRRTRRNEGAKWYGKMNTVIFYIVILMLIVFPDMPLAWTNGLLVLCGGSMTAALALYLRQYRQILKTTNAHPLNE